MAQIRRVLTPTIDTSHLGQAMEEEVLGFGGGKTIRLRHMLLHTATAGVKTKDNEVGHKDEDRRRQE